jgi:hypothetical protein
LTNTEFSRKSSQHLRTKRGRRSAPAASAFASSQGQRYAVQVILWYQIPYS